MRQDELKAILVAGRAKIANPEDWTQGVLARDSRGVSIAPESPKACTFCAAGAILSVCPEGMDTLSRYRHLWKKLDSAALQLYHVYVHDVNDLIGHEAVLRVYDHAINEISED